MRTIQVTINDQPPRAVPAQTPALAVLPELAANGLAALGALVNNETVSLTCPLNISCRIAPLTLADPHGWRIYRWSLTYLLAKAAHETFPQCALRVHHALGDGLYCRLEWPRATPARHRQRVARLETAMRRLVARDLPIEPVCASYEEALTAFREAGQADKVHLLSHRNPPQVRLVECDGFRDLQQGPMVHRTGLLADFALLPYPPGFVLQMPTCEHPRLLTRSIPSRTCSPSTTNTRLGAGSSGSRPPAS